MHLPLLLALSSALQLSAPADSIAVAIPRMDLEAVIDGRLDDAVWRNAARISGFHQYQPVDSRPAEERTEVLIWYSPSAIYFGVVAHARDASAIRATLADRDNISSDDRITIYLDTFHDRRRAYLFGVNPLGVQLDGVRTEGAFSAGSPGGGTVDHNPDFLFDSHGTVSDSGYVVEIRIPFSSLRYGSDDVQQWGLQVSRDNAATGYTDTWTDVRRAGASFLAQAGTITGLTGLERGIVMEAQPFVTASATGERNLTSGSFDRNDPEFSGGVNVRFGFTQLTLDGTINPDFSQVESDAGLVTANERFALFLPEKRPFFLEGIELFATPNRLVYTRQIANPIAGAKLTGKLGKYSIAALSALDERSGSDALASVVRVRRDLFGNSIAGLTITDNEREGAFNRVLSADSRIVFGRLYYFEGQYANSWTRASDSTGTFDAPLWKAEVDRTGRHFGFNYQLNGVSQNFVSGLGFVPRTGIVNGHFLNRFTVYGGRGALFEDVSLMLRPERLWSYEDFDIGGGGALEGDNSATLSITARGGWETRFTVSRGFFKLPATLFAGYSPASAPGTQYESPDELAGLDGMSISVESPIWQLANGELDLRRQEVAIFAEGSEGRETRGSATLELRPTDDIRVQATGTVSRILRARDNSEFARTIIPRIRLEYQATRSLFFRVVGEYRSERQSALLSATTAEPLLVNGVAVAATEDGSIHHEWLISYQPTPGTVAFLGYSSNHVSPSATEFRDFERTSDGFFLKLAYRFRR